MFTGLHGLICKKHKMSIKHIETQLFWYDPAKNLRNFNIFASGVSWCKNSSKNNRKTINFGTVSPNTDGITTFLIQPLQEIAVNVPFLLG